MKYLKRQFSERLIPFLLFIISGTSLIAQEKQQYNVAIFLYQNVELLDFAGPTEVFAATAGFKVYTVSVDGKEILSQGLLTVKPQYSISNAPIPDIVVLPGGNSGPSSKDRKVIEWVQSRHRAGTLMLSVCTGVFILARAGLLENLAVTTHYGSISSLQTLLKNSKVLEHTRFVDNGNILTTAGVSAGIDGALHAVARIKGVKVAKATARYMEYDKWDPNNGKIVYRNQYLQQQQAQANNAPKKNFPTGTPIPFQGELEDCSNDLLSKGLNQQAAHLLEAGIQWYPNSAALYNQLSKAYKKIGKQAPMDETTFLAMIDEQKVDEAMIAYEKLIRKFPGWKVFDEMILNDKAYELMKKEEYDIALKLFQLNAKTYPASYNVWDSLGEAYMRTGDKRAAIASYQKSLDLNPENANAKQMLGQLGLK